MRAFIRRRGHALSPTHGRERYAHRSWNRGQFTSFGAWPGGRLPGGRRAPFVQRARALPRHSPLLYGAWLRRSRPPGNQLTPTRNVARLAATGATSNEIATRLFLSPRTVAAERVTQAGGPLPAASAWMPGSGPFRIVFALKRGPVGHRRPSGMVISPPS
ncbi:LuxR C-terminal-related transcriptional regulator [Nonomuraea zeae]|uniref:HTH luxR-type domain-containing protein n=1 Tax=Nonomuraea zeae TaxID=1642303 RepID=A0A5S4GRR3_9ACTN|nr:hypothetical protein ETD85_13490 [Nonomuraea zeae]